MKAVSVRIARRATTAREYDAITIVIGDLRLSCDLTSDREIRMAKKLADDHQAAFIFDDANAERVKTALGFSGLDSAV